MAHNRLVNVLIVDDDEVAAMSIKRALSRAGVSRPIRVARDGEEALQTLRSGDLTGCGATNLILLDLNMPVMNGFEFLHALRQDPRLCTSVVFVTSTSDSPLDIESAYRHQAAGYILKDTRNDTLAKSMEMLRYYLEVVHLPLGIAAAA